MHRLSSPISELKQHYDVVVIGSGYGGSIAASRLARAGRKVCLLERGRELHPGEYPDNPREAKTEMQVTLPDGKHLGSTTALYDFRFFDDINVFIGCGLGGTSLINANVSLEVDPRVLDDPIWPRALTRDAQQGLKQAYQRASQWLGATPYPQSGPQPKKLQAMGQCAIKLGAELKRPPLNVTFKSGQNIAGVEQSACTLCGDCVSGCNFAAKNTTLMNYLPDAWQFGAEIFCQCQARYLIRDPDNQRWQVFFQHLDAGQEQFDAPEQFITADMVVVSAGALGSTEILLRSREYGLTLSSRLGRRFTGNGDVLGFAYNADIPINGIGMGDTDAESHEIVGPCITGLIDLRDHSDWKQGMVVEEGSIPGAVAPLVSSAFSMAAKAFGKDTDFGLADEFREKWRELQSLLKGPYHGAASHTQTFLVMSHDDGAGKLSLTQDQLQLSWPGVGHQEVFYRVNGTLLSASEALGATFVHNPIWNKLTDNQLVTVHPLGGCGMGDNADRGVVNDICQVFCHTVGNAVYDDLLVCDGAVLPRAVGVNPLLTISAITERACSQLAAQNGWQIDWTTPAPKTRPVPATPIGIQFTERMSGFVSVTETNDYQQAYEKGQTTGGQLSFTLTIIADDLDQLLNGSAHEAGMSGTVSCSALSDHPLSVHEGRFHLLTESSEEVNTLKMLYRMRLTSREGKTFYFVGFKRIKDHSGPDLWSDTTTLYVTLHTGTSSADPIYCRGILNIAPADFARQMSTVRVLNAPDKQQRLKAMARFGQYFAGELFHVYGGVFAPARKDMLADAPPRKRRLLRAPAPQVYPVTTEDGVQLRLTRYHGGDKGPVILSHGLGVSSQIFSIDTIDTNLVEYLTAHGYDCWLMDYRVSVDLPAASQRCSGDEIASYDYPACVEAVRRITRRDTVQFVAHCFGATTLTMALLHGLLHVRSAVISQVSTHVQAPPITEIKCALHLPETLDKIGFSELTADVSSDAPWYERAFDKALALYPDAFGDPNPVSRRISFLYGPLYERDNLNTATYKALHEMFGVANIDCFKHLATIVRRGQVVAADGQNRYLPHLQRMALPITFIHGAKNRCFLPVSTVQTMQALSQANGADLYTRRVIAGYGHIDCIYGKNAVEDVYPHIIRHLEQTA